MITPKHAAVDNFRSLPQTHSFQAFCAYVTSAHIERSSVRLLPLLVALLLAPPAHAIDITEVIDSTGDGAGNTLQTPSDIAVAVNGDVYVAGGVSDNAFKITPELIITEIIDAAGDGAAGGLDYPSGIAVDPKGNIYISGFKSNNAFKVTSSGAITEIINATSAGTSLIGPYAIAVDDVGAVYLACINSHNVLKITPEGIVTTIINWIGDGKGNNLDGPSDVAVDVSGNVYVAGGGSDNVFKITPAGSIVEIIDSAGDGAGSSLDYPTGVAVDAAGNVYVSGYYTNNAFKITPSGAITEIIPQGLSGLNGPFVIGADIAGNSYMSGSSWPPRVVKVTPGGSITTILDGLTDGLNYTSGITVDTGGNVYVVGAYSNNAFMIGGIPFIPETPPPPPSSRPNAEDEGQSQGGQNPDSPAPTVNGLVFITHGWIPSGEPSDWIDEMKTEIVARLVEQGTAAEWNVVAYHWEDQAKGFINPAGAARNAALNGQRLGAYYAGLGAYVRYHLISHSAGSWLIENIAEQLEGTGATIHTTFLDSYVPWQYSSEQLGDSSSWSEHYVDGYALPDPTQPAWVDRTDYRLVWPYNLVLTGLSASADPIKRHAFPYEWYLQTVKTPGAPLSQGWGFARSQEMGTLPSHAMYAHGEAERLGPLAMRVVNHVRTAENIPPYALDLANGIVEWATSPLPSFLRLRTQSPAWAVSNVVAQNEFNALQFDYEFVSDGEGWFSVHFAGEEVLARDERYALDGPEPQTIDLGQTYPPGSYPLSFRLDPYSAVDSEVHVTNLGFALIRPAPTVSAISNLGRILLGLLLAVVAYALARSRSVEAL